MLVGPDEPIVAEDAGKSDSAAALQRSKQGEAQTNLGGRGGSGGGGNDADAVVAWRSSLPAPIMCASAARSGTSPQVLVIRVRVYDQWTTRSRKVPETKSNRDDYEKFVLLASCVFMPKTRYNGRMHSVVAGTSRLRFGGHVTFRAFGESQVVKWIAIIAGFR